MSVYTDALQRVLDEVVAYRFVGGDPDRRPIRIDMHPDTLSELLIEAPLTENMGVSPAPDDYRPRLRGIPIQGDPRIAPGQIEVIW